MAETTYPSLAHEFTPSVSMVSVLLIFLVFCVVVLCVFTYWVPCSDLRYDFQIKTMFGSSLPPVVCRGLMSYLLYLCWFTYCSVQHILCCVLCYGWPRLVCPVLLFLVVCPVLLFLVVCPVLLFLGIVHSGLSLQFSLTCISFILLRIIVLKIVTV